MLLLTIAGGVFLGWLAIEAFRGLCKAQNYTVPEAILKIVGWTIWLGLIGVCGLIVVLAIEHESEIGQFLSEYRNFFVICAAIIMFGGFGLAVYSDLQAKAEAKKIAIDTFCTQCGQQGLTFHGFQDGLKEGHKYPVGSCTKCGHEQQL